MFLYHCISEGNVFRKCSMSFSFHLTCYMPDKAVFVSSALLCVQPTAVTGETSSSPALKRLLLAENEFAFLISPSDLSRKHFLLVIIK